MELKIKKVRENAKIPTRGTDGAAGFDLYACIDEPMTLNKGDTALIPTGIAIAVPNKYAAFIHSRSGLSIKKGICLLNSVGVVDSDYRGEIKCPLINLGSEDFEIKKGERIAQMVFMPVAQVCLCEKDNLDETDRGDGGFGSTGR